jgi:PUA domain protein
MKMSRHVVSKKEMKELYGRLRDIGLDAPFITENQIEVEEKKGKKLYYISKIPIALEAPDFYPTVELLDAIKPGFKNITIDNGAVPRILGGAKLFAQGIVEMDMGIKAEDTVFIRGIDGRYVAVGKASLDADKIMETKKGPAAEILLRGGQENI